MTQPGTQPLPDTQDINDVTCSQEEIIPWGFLCPLRAHFCISALTRPEYLVGRQPNCDIIISKEGKGDLFSALSKIHFKITKQEDGLVALTDCSFNGTYVNHEIVGRKNVVILQHNDLISLAKSQYIVYVFLDRLAGDDNMPPAIKDKYVVSRVLGKGAFGEVKLVFNKRTFSRFAMKCVEKKHINLQSNSTCIENEVDILRRLHHSFIIEYHDIVDTPQRVYMLLEFMEGGDLFTRIKTEKSLSESYSKWILHQVSLAVVYLHSQGIAHRDLKPENILLSSQSPEPVAKVTDFGLSRFFSSHSVMKTMCGTRMFTAPEILQTQGMGSYSKDVDVWSLGVILFMCLSGCTPFKIDGDMSLERQIVSGAYSFPSKYWGTVSSDAQDAVKKMMTVDPKRRIKAEHISKHPWFKDEAMVRKIKALLHKAGDENVPPRKRQRCDDTETLSRTLSS